MGNIERGVTSELRVVPAEFDRVQIEQEHADVHLVAIDDNEGSKAQCSLWWSQVPMLPHERVGTIGHYHAENENAALIVLAAACDRLRRAGCTCAIGPMDGNPWRRYRFVTEQGNEPAFFLEPQNPPAWPEHFVNAGFSPLAGYVSALNSDLVRADLRLNKAEARLRFLGVALRSLRPCEIETYLSRIYRVCCVAFRNNYLYAELSEDDFFCQYKQLLPVLCPELLIVAEQQSETVGFVFAVPDLLRSAHDLPLDTFIIKTVAILPRRELAGLGSLLVGTAHQMGAQMGFRRCIHALMQERNMLARNISEAYATRMRRYTIYSRDLRV